MNENTLRNEVTIKDIRNECRNFFNLTETDTIPDPPIKFLFTRKEMDEVLGRKTEPWERAVTNSRGLFFIDESVLEEITPHKKGDFWQVVHHEMSHWYLDHIVGSFSGRPKWFVEGLAEVMAGQKTMLPANTDESVTDKYFDDCDQETYRWGRVMVKKLVDDYGKDRVVELVHKMGPKMTRDDFAQSFHQVFGISLIDFENDIKTIIKQKWAEKRGESK